MSARTGDPLPQHDARRRFTGRGMALGLFAATLGVLAVALVIARAPAPERLSRALLEALIIGVPVIAGMFAVRFPRNRRFGHLLIAAGCAWSLTALAEASASLPYSVGRLVGWTVPPIMIYLMLAFPEGRLATRIDRGLFSACILLVLSLYVGSALFIDAYPTQTPWSTCAPDCPANAFQVVAEEPAVLNAVVQPVREGLTAVVLLAIIVALIRRTRAASPFLRRAMLPVVGMSVASAATLIAFLLVRRAAPGSALADDLGGLWSLTIPGMAGAFLAGIIRQRLMLGDTLAGLGRDLNHRLDLAEIRRTIARTLGDESIDLLVPDGVTPGWRDTRGGVVSTAGLEARGRELTVIRDDDGVPVAALSHDPALPHDDELSEGVRGVLRTAMRQTRLTRQLARSLVDLDESRARIARAADAERSRIERDLHDGAQQRLIALRIRLSLAEELARQDPRQWAEAVKELGPEVERALDELRELAHGVYPSVLTDRGLKDALRAAAAQAPGPVTFDGDGIGRVPKDIETAVYFACAEAIQNACKHATGASFVRVALWQDGGLSFEVSDDGPGFRPERRAAGGVRNMRDRVEAVGGALTINAAPGHGTRVRAGGPPPTRARAA